MTLWFKKHIRYGVGPTLLAGLLLCSGYASWARQSLTADEVIHRMSQRAETSKVEEEKQSYQYQKRTVTEELDSKGKVKERKEKLVQVEVSAGVSNERPLSLNGEKSREPEKKRKVKDTEEHSGKGDSKPKKKGDKHDEMVSQEILAKFKFTLLPQEVVANRTNYVIAFKAKDPEHPGKKLEDKFLSKLAGRIWVDAEEFELTKADIHLLGEVTLWGGVLGTLRRCDFMVLRSREVDGIWIEKSSQAVFEGRKLIDTVSVRTSSEASDFQKPPG